ncbi:hypothetical protein BC828DRAFT_346723 [Blastocladiella britannica]|nr:hypothetical protein BC828DRAFT_346723 [Blastocladiella britannica]
MAFTEEQLQDHKEIFSLFDRRGTGVVEADQVGDLLRAIGANPTEAQVAEIVGTLPADKKQISFEQFLEILGRPNTFKPPGSTDDFIQGFAVFDKDGTGFISMAELRYVLTSLGEKLSDSDVDELLRYVEVAKDGTVRYEGA